MYYYIYLAAGAKRTPHPEKYPARAQQLRNKEDFEEICEVSLTLIEKVARVTNLASLPILRACLLHARQEGARVVMDDLRRVFHRCDIPDRLALMKELLVYRHHLGDLRHENQLLSQFGVEGLQELLYVSRPPSFEMFPRNPPLRPKARRKQQTARARTVSAAVRGRKADAAADRLIALRRELLGSHGAVSLQCIADHAHARGLRTTRGNDWTAAGISRALNRRSADERAQGTTKGVIQGPSEPASITVEGRSV